jgi:hypothetical protein
VSFLFARKLAIKKQRLANEKQPKRGTSALLGIERRKRTPAADPSIATNGSLRS